MDRSDTLVLQVRFLATLHVHTVKSDHFRGVYVATVSNPLLKIWIYFSLFFVQAETVASLQCAFCTKYRTLSLFIVSSIASGSIYNPGSRLALDILCNVRARLNSWSAERL